MQHIEELKIKYDIDTNLTFNFSFVYSYSKDSEDPIVFSHYVHDQNLTNPTSFSKNKEYCTLFIILSGKVSFAFDNSFYNPSYGCAIVIRNHEKYTTCFNTDSHLDYYEINFPVEFFEKIPKINPFYDIFYKRNSGEKNMIILDKLNCESTINKLKKIEKIINQNGKFQDMIIYSYITQIVGIIQNKYRETIDNVPILKAPAKLKTAIDYIHNHFTTIENLDNIAEHSGITVPYLSRIFKKHLLCTPIEYITNLRISHAKYLLSQDYSITDACFKSGFNNYTYFISKFKSVTGITPSKFKKEAEQE